MKENSSDLIFLIMKTSSVSQNFSANLIYLYSLPPLLTFKNTIISNQLQNTSFLLNLYFKRSIQLQKSKSRLHDNASRAAINIRDSESAQYRNQAIKLRSVNISAYLPDVPPLLSANKWTKMLLNTSNRHYLSYEEDNPNTNLETIYTYTHRLHTICYLLNNTCWVTQVIITN